MAQQKFDGLADDYDLSRPRYPDVLFDAIVRRLPARDDLAVVDAGTGTGIALEGLVPRLPHDVRITAVDLSPDMVRKGWEKFSQVTWVTSPAEPYLESCSNLDLVLAAQAYQWMDRPRFLAAARAALRDGGVVAIIQNNRDDAASRFLDEYETLLEARSPGYSRDYRSFDIEAELATVFGAERTSFTEAAWSRPMLVAEFVSMATSSTQAQRALAVHPDFLAEVSELAKSHADDGSLAIAYRSELIMAER